MRIAFLLTLSCLSLVANAFDAAEYGFAPEKSGRENLVAFQKALDRGGLVEVTKPGRYRIADTLLIGSDTTIRCAPGVVFVKSDEGKKARNAYLCKYWAAKKQGDAARFAETWKTRHPGGAAPKYMEAYEVSEYGRSPTAEDLKLLND